MANTTTIPTESQLLVEIEDITLLNEYASVDDFFKTLGV